MELTNLGAVGVSAGGVYNPETVYKKYKIVSANGGSYMYINPTPAAGVDVADTTHWQQISEKGDAGGPEGPEGPQGPKGDPGLGGGGKNILHNWDFRNPVNQRRVSGAISATGYFYDRWMLNSGTVTVNADYLAMASGAVVEQRIEGLYLAGETVTVSVKVGSTIYSGTGVFPTAAGTAAVALTGFGTATLGYNAGYMYVLFTASGSQNVEVVKLELGTVSTLHLDPPMDWAVELAKCQRFFFHSDPVGNAFSIRFPVAYMYDTTWHFRGNNGFPTTMRITPTAEIVYVGIGFVGDVISYASVSDISSSGITGIDISGRSAAPTSTNNLYARMKFSADL